MVTNYQKKLSSYIQNKVFVYKKWLINIIKKTEESFKKKHAKGTKIFLEKKKKRCEKKTKTDKKTFLKKKKKKVSVSSGSK